MRNRLLLPYRKRLIPLASGRVLEIGIGVVAALWEMRRVLKPSGQLLFVEHGLAPEEGIRRWQHRLTPLWKDVAGGCHLDRPIVDLVRSAGFEVEHVETGYMPGPKPMTFMYEGVARLL
jgi:hypothetical protein